MRTGDPPDPTRPVRIVPGPCLQAVVAQAAVSSRPVATYTPSARQWLFDRSTSGKRPSGSSCTSTTRPGILIS